jgi:hypothetical protein
MRSNHYAPRRGQPIGSFGLTCQRAEGWITRVRGVNGTEDARHGLAGSTPAAGGTAEDG